VAEPGTSRTGDDRDAAGVAALRQVAETLTDDGITLAPARVKSPLQRRLDEVGFTAAVGRERF
jgi:hypothetical protein